MKMKRQDVLLLLIEGYCDDASGAYYAQEPYVYEKYCFMTKQHIYVNGPGDPAALKSLLRKGLIKEVRSPGTGSDVLGYRITEDGRLRSQTLA